MLRAAVAAQSELGRRAKGHMDRGELVPDDLVIAVAEERLEAADAKLGFVLDGFPRTAAQAEALDALLARRGVRLERCIALRVDEDAVIARLRRRAGIEGRSDDNEETVRTRIRVYEKETAPLVEYYRGRSILAQVDGVGTVDEVAQRIEEALAG
jgi:adenylate kinase